MMAQPAAAIALRRERLVGLRPVAGDRIELVERAAGVAEAAAGDHRHDAAAGGDDRREHQRDVVADAAGRMLVDDRPLGVRPGEHVAGIAHRQRQRDALVHAHAAEEDGHGEGRHLPFADAAVGQPLDQEGDLILGERAAVALLADRSPAAGSASAPAMRRASASGCAEAWRRPAAPLPSSRRARAPRRSCRQRNW